MLRRLAQELGTQVTLEDAILAVESAVDDQLPYDCPKCGKTGQLNAGTTECDYCDGWSKTTESTISQVTYSPAVQPIPSLTIEQTS